MPEQEATATETTAEVETQVETNVEETLPEEDNIPDKPTSRGKTPLDYILERKKAQEIKKLSQKKDEYDEDEDDDLAPEDRKGVQKRVKDEIESSVSPHLEALSKQAVEFELQKALTDIPIAKHFTPKQVERFKEYAQDPSRANVPFETIMLEVIGFEGLMRLGAKQEREAAKKAAQSSTGTSQQSSTKAPNVLSMSNDEYKQWKKQQGLK